MKNQELGLYAILRHTVVNWTVSVLVDPDTATRAHAASARNVWKSHRADRDPHLGLFRYGFARCGSCGRALSVVSTGGAPVYRCENGKATGLPCPAPVSITVDHVDEVAWWWVQDTISDPRNGARYAVVHQAADPDPDTVATLTRAEQRVAGLTAQANGLLANLGFLTGPTAALAAERITALNEGITEAMGERDRLAAQVTRTATVAPTVHPEDALARAGWAAITAMRTADPDAIDININRVALWTTEDSDWKLVVVEVPSTWTARRAALSALDVTLTVRRQDESPRWTIDMRLAGGNVRQGEAVGGGGLYLTATRAC